MSLDDNIVKMPDLLERLAKRLSATLIRDTRIRQEWIETKLEQAEVLATAKAQFASTIKFGEWLHSNGLGDNVISHQERAGLIALGSDLPRARLVLEQTDRWSIEGIHRNEWTDRVTSVRKSLSPPGGPKREKALAYVQIYEAEHRKLPSEIEINRDTGVSRGTGADVLRDIKSKRSEDDVRVTYTKAQDKHVEARVRMLSKKLEEEFEERVRLRVLAENDPYREVLRKLKEEAEGEKNRYESLNNYFKPIFNETEFTVILTCLHPDNSASIEKRNTAFRAFNAMKLQLTGKR